MRGLLGLAVSLDFLAREPPSLSWGPLTTCPVSSHPGPGTVCVRSDPGCSAPSTGPHARPIPAEPASPGLQLAPPETHENVGGTDTGELYPPHTSLPSLCVSLVPYPQPPSICENRLPQGLHIGAQVVGGGAALAEGFAHTKGLGAAVFCRLTQYYL